MPETSENSDIGRDAISSDARGRTSSPIHIARADRIQILTHDPAANLGATSSRPDVAARDDRDIAFAGQSYNELLQVEATDNEPAHRPPSNDNGPTVDLPAEHDGTGVRPPRRDAMDLGAGAIGSVAEKLADAIANILTPPSPAEQAQARRQAARQAQMQPDHDELDQQRLYAQFAEAAITGLNQDKHHDRARRERHVEDRERERER